MNVPGPVETITITAPPERIYDLVADVTNTGNLSPEARRVEWAAGSARAVAGARFRGRSQWRGFAWWRQAQILRAERGQEFVFQTDPGRGIYNDTTTWHYRFDRIDDRTTTVTETYSRQAPRWLHTMDAILGRPKALQQAMRRTLANLKHAAEQEARRS